MFRGTLIERHHQVVDDFRWRTREPSRIEGFSDAVFGFALTLLIVSLEVPKTSAELFETMRGFGGFVLSFTMLASIWYAQFLFFRRYGLEDRLTVTLNLILLFTVLFAIPTHDRALLLVIFGLGMAAVFLVFLLLYRHAYKKRDELELNEIEIYATRHSIQKQTIPIALACTYSGSPSFSRCRITRLANGG